jgi:hypothetical protein
LIERPVNLDDFTHTSIKEWFAALGFSRLLSPPGVANESLVREFYCNISNVALIAGSPSFKTYVRGKDFTITPASLCSIIGVPTPAQCFFPFEDVLDQDSIDDIDYTDVASLLCGKSRVWDSKLKLIKQADFTEAHRILNLIVSFNVYPTGNTSTLTKEYSYLLYAIVTGKPIDFGSLMVRHMARTVTSSNALPFGLWVTVFLMMHGVRSEATDILGKEPTPIDSKTLARSIAHLKHAVDLDAESAETPEQTVNCTQFDTLLEVIHDLIKSVQAGETRCLDRLAELAAHLPVALKNSVTAAAAEDLAAMKAEMVAFRVQLEDIQHKLSILIEQNLPGAV